MSLCPFCGHQNIPGEDECVECRQPLGFLTTPRPRTPLEKSIQADRVSALEPRDPMIVHRDTAVGEVIRRLVNWQIGSVLVVDGREQLMGIFTERDALLRIGADLDQVQDLPVARFMTPNPMTIDENERIAQALQKMDQGEYRHLPVLREGRVCGVISVRDILRYCSEKLAQEVA